MKGGLHVLEHSLLLLWFNARYLMQYQACCLEIGHVWTNYDQVDTIANIGEDEKGDMS